MNRIIIILICINYSNIIYTQTPFPGNILENNTAFEELGKAVAIAGDVNGDGYDDVIVGGENNKAYVYHGSESGILPTPNVVIYGEPGSIYFGLKVASAGDVNGDGYDDVFISDSWFASDHGYEGKIYIYHGSATGINPIPVITIEGNHSSAHYGFSIAKAGDVNNDGYDDIIVGAKHLTAGHYLEGRAFIYHGSISGIISVAATTVESNQDYGFLGTSVAGAGDVNNDGFDDIIVGATGYDNGQADEGRAFVYHGSVSGIINVAVTTMEANQALAGFGNSVSGIGDVNNDGYDDVVVGAMWFDNPESGEGKIWVYHGSSIGINNVAVMSYESNEDNSYLGNCVSPAGDINNDGYDDLIVGAYSYTNNLYMEGRTYIFQGSPAGLISIPVRSMESDQINAFFGVSVSGDGDINGDGFTDVIVGCNGYSNGQSEEGAAFVYYGDNCASSIYYFDNDHDGYGNPLQFVITCSMPEGYLETGTDCNESDANQNPMTVWYFDGDFDDFYAGTGSPVTQCPIPSWGYVFGDYLSGGDCNDASNIIYPGAFEQIDGNDNNCNGLIDEGLNMSLDVILESNKPFAKFGYSVSDAGDLNGDGFGDIIVGSYNYSNVQSNEGRIDVFHGTADGFSLYPVMFIESDQATAYMGNAVSGAGDVNGDGFDDLIYAAHSYTNGETDEGRVYIHHGSPLGISGFPNLILEINQSSAFFGSSVSNAGDIDNDGYDDIIIGANKYDNGQTDEGAAFIYRGSSTGIIATPAAILEPNLATSNFGFSVGTAGDVNNDGYDDIIVGADLYNNGDGTLGKVFIYHGSPVGISLVPNTTITNDDDSNFGNALSTAGDVNMDGYDDIIIGASKYDDAYTNEGRCYIFNGSELGINPLPVTIIEGNQSNVYFGASVSEAGDVNADGFGDIIIGANEFSDPQSDEGKAFVYTGSPTGINLDPFAEMSSNQIDSEFGWSVSTAGDVNNDGFSDVVVGAFNYDRGHTDEGAAYIYFGSNCVSVTYYADTDIDGFGNEDISIVSCSAPPGYTESGGDCNDTNFSINPSSPELCNSLDDNCNGLIDDAITETISISAGGPITFCQGGNVLLTATYSGATVQWKKNGTNIPGATSPTYLVNSKGTYSCETTSACDIELSTGIFVNVQKNPPASITAGGATTFCAGGSVILTANAGGGLSYQWYKGATLIAGATSINYTATIGGNYKCRVTKTATGCFKNSNVISVSVPCKEGELISENTIHIYPNPANDKITISFDREILSKTQLTIVEVTGKIVKEFYILSNQTDINISEFAAGVYFIQGNINGIVYSEIFVKE
jgi:hypothetical protein